MANALGLTQLQIVALRAAARGENPYPALHAFLRSVNRSPASAGRTIKALARRGLVTIDHVLAITPAGRAALFNATGEHGGQP